MMAFRDLFGSRRRTNPRIPVRWFVDVQLPASEQFVGFYTLDISLLGLRLRGGGCCYRPAHLQIRARFCNDSRVL